MQLIRDHILISVMIWSEITFGSGLERLSPLLKEMYELRKNPLDCDSLDFIPMFRFLVTRTFLRKFILRLKDGADERQPSNRLMLASMTLKYFDFTSSTVKYFWKIGS